MQPPTVIDRIARLPASCAHLLIRAYQLSLSGLLGRQCRHLPSCSAYMDEAILRNGLWTGGWMGLARLCRCHPFGTSGLDFVPDTLPDGACWYRPWVYGRWRSCYRGPAFICEPVDPGDGLSRL